MERLNQKMGQNLTNCNLMTKQNLELAKILMEKMIKEETRTNRKPWLNLSTFLLASTRCYQWCTKQTNRVFWFRMCVEKAPIFFLKKVGTNLDRLTS